MEMAAVLKLKRWISDQIPKGPKYQHTGYLGFLYKNCYYGFGNIPYIGVPGPLGNVVSRLKLQV